MHILILNWRDIKNPQSGGAEILTHEISKTLIDAGHKVTLFSSMFSGAKKYEHIDGVKIIREGNPDLRSGFSSVHFKAYKYYKKGKFGKIDFVVDEVHGLPFFTPLYMKEKKAALICEYAGDLWKYAVPFPLNIMARSFEHMYPLLYRRVPVITISKSSQRELSQLFPLRNIQVVYPGCSFPIVKKIPPKSGQLNLIFIARIAKTKGVEDAIEVIEVLNKKEIDSKLYIIGRGDVSYVSYLKNQVKKKGLEKQIFFSGFVSEKEKRDLIDKSTFLLLPSRKEGWGLTVHEVGSRGVPSVGYEVPGLSEVIVSGVNGELSKKKNPEDIADICLRIYSNKNAYKKLQLGAISERKKYTWDKTGETFLKLINMYATSK